MDEIKFPELIQEYEREILRLKKALNSEIRHNNDLLEEVNFLKLENQQIRGNAVKGKGTTQK